MQGLAQSLHPSLRPVEGLAGQATCPLTVDCGLGMRIWGTPVRQEML